MTEEDKKLNAYIKSVRNSKFVDDIVQLAFDNGMLGGKRAFTAEPSWGHAISDMLLVASEVLNENH